MKPKVIKEKQPYWPQLVGVWFAFCREKFEGKEPSYDGSAPRDMKELIEVIRARAEKAGKEWTEAEAVKRWRAFLVYAYTDEWLSTHWILSNLLRQKDRIFFGTIIPKKNGASNKQPRPEANTTGSFGQL